MIGSKLKLETTRGRQLKQSLQEEHHLRGIQMSSIEDMLFWYSAYETSVGSPSVYNWKYSFRAQGRRGTRVISLVKVNYLKETAWKWRK